MRMQGKTDAALEWAKGWKELDGFLKLNALINREGEATFSTAYNDRAVIEYNDGTAKREYTFQLRMIAPWSDGYDSINIEAERLATEWYDWVAEQYDLGNLPDWGEADIESIEPMHNAPALNAVFQEDSTAEYVIQAIITYIE